MRQTKASPRTSSPTGKTKAPALAPVDDPLDDGPGFDPIEIAVEVGCGERPAKRDNAAARAYRKQIRKEIAEIEAKGWIVDLPFD